MASDCRAGEGVMCIFGKLLEFEWKIVLSDIDERWKARHSTVGESTGSAVNVAVFGTPFRSFQLIQEGDNMTEGPMMLGRARTEDQRAIGSAMRGTRGYKDCSENLWFEHAAGLGLGFVDAGSRSYEGVLTNLAAAFGRQRTVIDATRSPEVMHMLG